MKLPFRIGGEEYFVLPDGRVVVPRRVTRGGAWHRLGSVLLLLEGGARVPLSVDVVGWLLRNRLWRSGRGGSFLVVVGEVEVRVWEEGGWFWGEVYR